MLLKIQEDHCILQANFRGRGGDTTGFLGCGSEGQYETTMILFYKCIYIDFMLSILNKQAYGALLKKMSFNLILSCLIWFHLLWSHSITSDHIWSRLIGSNLIWGHLMPFGLIWSNMITSDLIQSNLFWSHVVYSELM